VLVFALGGGDDGTTPDDATANAGEQAGKQETAPAAADPVPTKGGDPVEAAADPVEAATDPVEAAATDAAADPAPPKPDPKPAKTFESRNDVYNPKTDLEPVDWPDYVTEAERTEILSMLGDVQDGGLPGSRAKTKLEELSHKSLAGIINALRQIDYFDSWESMYAYELNRLLEAMTVGINVGFKPTNLDEEIPFEIVDWNAKTAKAWHRLLEKYPTPEDFARLRKSRKTRNK
jgi:hypothetical protein